MANCEDPYLGDQFKLAAMLILPVSILTDDVIPPRRRWLSARTIVLYRPTEIDSHKLRSETCSMLISKSCERATS